MTKPNFGPFHVTDAEHDVILRSIVEYELALHVVLGRIDDTDLASYFTPEEAKEEVAMCRAALRKLFPEDE